MWDQVRLAYRMARPGTSFTDPASGFTLSWADGREPEVKAIPNAAWGAAVDRILAGEMVAALTAGKA
jgi:hypothetical protein